MIILSIDVGIKNLAFCLANIDKINNTNNFNIDFKILDWSIINLINNNICNQIKSCKCNAKFIISRNLTSDNLNTDNIKNNIENNTENNIENNNIKYLCNKHSEKYDKKNLIKIKNNNSNNTSLINITSNIINELNNYFDNIKKTYNIFITDISNIIIENQIGPLAIRMKSIQALLTMYFVFNNNNNIIYINSSNKLKYFDDKNTSYKDRKKKGIIITELLLNNNFKNFTNEKLNKYKINIFSELWINYFKINKKRDDLADCFLQLLYFIIN